MAQARADTLVATRPGLMCKSADALAKLTLPDGSSRTQSTRARPEDMVMAGQGYCIDIPHAARVTVQRARKNTSIVLYDADDGRGPQTYVVPNIDFVPASQAAPTPYCVAQDAQVSMRGVLIEAVGHNQDTGASWRYFMLRTTRPYCIEPGPDIDQASYTPTTAITVVPSDELHPESLRQYLGRPYTMTGKISGSNGGGPLLFNPQFSR